jgi:hypothetical protein
VVLDVPAQARLSAATAVPAVVPAAVPAVVPAVTSTPGAPADLDATDRAPTASPTDGTDVLDAGLRARLDGSPIAFHRSP